MDLNIDFLFVFYFGNFKWMCSCVFHAFHSNDMFETFIRSMIEEIRGYKKYKCETRFKGFKIDKHKYKQGLGLKVYKYKYK